MGHDILQLFLGLDIIGTNANAILVVEAALGLFRTCPAPDVVGTQIPAELLDVLAHVDDDRGSLQQLVPVLLAPRAVKRTRPLVAVPPVFLHPVRAHLARRHPVEVLCPVEPAVAGEEVGAVPSVLRRRDGGITAGDAGIGVGARFGHHGVKGIEGGRYVWRADNKDSRLLAEADYI